MNKLTKLLGIKYPIIQGPMAWITEAELAIAVGEAGGAGVIACGSRNAAWIREEVKKVRAATDKPFGLNVPLLDLNKDELLRTACEEKVPFVTIGAGNPIPYIESFKKAGIKVICVIPNLKLAKRVEDNGADAIVIEGMEAGGHIGSITTMALLTNIIPEMKIPVIAAGGIADGRGMAAAFLMGAAGVQIGTAFLLAEECTVHMNVKRRLIEAMDTDSVVTGLLHGHSARCLKNDFTEKYLGLERTAAPQEKMDQLATGTSRLSAVEGDIANGSVFAGQSLVRLKSIRPVREIIESIYNEAVEVLNKAPGLLIKRD